MQAKTIEIILTIIETIVSIFVSSRSENKGGNNNDSTGSSKKK